MSEHIGRNPEAKGGRILVVDDEGKNRALLRDLLEADGHEVFEACDGQEALELTQVARPDVILLDVMLPKLDGFEVCRRLKASPATAPIPVLLVTSLSGRSERLQGIRAGANDFITKPVDTADLIVRVQNSVTTKRLFDQVEDQYRQLQRLEAMRDDLVHMIIHDLRSPLTGLLGYLDLLRSEATAHGDCETVRYAEEAERIALRLRDMTNTVLDVSRLEVGKMPLARAKIDMREVVAQALQVLGPQAGARVQFDKPDDPMALWGDDELLRRVVGNLVGNALKFTPMEGAIRVDLIGTETEVSVSVADSGAGIPVEAQGHIFDKFSQTTAGAQWSGHSAGLGLTFCKMAIEAHGGAIEVESVVGQGSIFRFRLPRDPRSGANLDAMLASGSPA